MPFIDCKVTNKLSDKQKDELKCMLGRAITNMHKPESYLMVGISDGYDLWFGGRKLESGAFVDVRAFGSVDPSDCGRMTAAICDALSVCASVDPSGVYITYEGYENWGWRGENF